MKIRIDGEKITAAGFDDGIEIGEVPEDFLYKFALGKYVWDGSKVVVSPEYKEPPDWNKFLDSLGKQPTVAVKLANSLLGSILMIRIQRLASGVTQWEGTDDTLILTWNNSANNISLSEQEEAGLNDLAVLSNLPVRVTDGKMIVV